MPIDEPMYIYRDEIVLPDVIEGDANLENEGEQNDEMSVNDADESMEDETIEKEETMENTSLFKIPSAEFVFGDLETCKAKLIEIKSIRDSNKANSIDQIENEDDEEETNDDAPLSKITSTELVGDKETFVTEINKIKRRSRNLAIGDSEKEEDSDEDSTEDGKEIKCPECKLRFGSVIGWMAHLRNKHSTTPALCEIARFEVIRRGVGPIKRLPDAEISTKSVEEKKRRSGRVTRPAKRPYPDYDFE
ncbi:hypothetical protein PMAYCL1PPCAC_01435 [Pristionchus mayeri]|uniref:C2H2-type domain-containing protein n=1 Tax=Pristionchus mayeri TaxID=1317129 RepID=A0AAN4Z4S2_9BILA|nr:hypothetical protein PMAYCL1PPCAC_01435 [Pristionchus mayeri]